MHSVLLEACHLSIKGIALGWQQFKKSLGPLMKQLLPTLAAGGAGAYFLWRNFWEAQVSTGWGPGYFCGWQIQIRK